MLSILILIVFALFDTRLRRVHPVSLGTPLTRYFPENPFLLIQNKFVWKCLMFEY